ncbi:MAG: hypothetical protein E6I96_01955 [Chloroflexi bacterium]|nr:MAG: hypothetical protein E6I96_01955 [Chloroflexota bacterium]
MGFAAGFGLAALFIGFFGLMVVFRKPLLPPTVPSARKMPPVGSAGPAPAVAQAPRNGSAPEAVEDEPELPAHEEEELPELPPHESDPPTA